MASMLQLLPLVLAVQADEIDGPYAWRNDSANLALTNAWNNFLVETPFSVDVTSLSISDRPPVSLQWSLGRDMPFAQKDGTGCWLAEHQAFVVTGGLWLNVTTNEVLHAEANGAHFSQALSYNSVDDSWSQLPAPPWMAGRGMGACTADSLYLVAGANTATPNHGCDVARLSKTNNGTWAWTMLPPLPLEGYRYSGSTGVIGDFLVVAGAANSTYRLHLPTAAKGKAWEKMADFPDAGMQGSSNDGVVNGSLYMFGGGSADTSPAAIAAFRALYALNLPVPIVTNMAACTRKSWRYDMAADTWHRLPDAPYHVERGGSVVLGGRYIVNLGSTHNKDSFRVGVNCLADNGTAGCQGGKPVGCKNGKCGKACSKPCKPGGSSAPADMRLGSGILSYYGDDVLAFDTVEEKWSRIGKMVYGLVTSHCGTNQTHIICIGGEPRHGHFSNTETVVQIAAVTQLHSAGVGSSTKTEHQMAGASDLPGGSDVAMKSDDGGNATMGTLAPSVYWVSSPTLPNETLVLAGAFPSNRVARLCTTRDCDNGSVVSTQALADSWQHSVKLVLPASCGPPCFVHVAAATTSSSTMALSTVVAVNAPDVWWLLSGSPASQHGRNAKSRDELSNLPLHVTVQQGSTLRIFGRSLAWSGVDHGRCVSSAGAPSVVSTTQLLLDDNLIPAVSATCYEATFNVTTRMGAGTYPETIVVTPWGQSQAMHLTIVAPAVTLPTYQLSVDPPTGAGLVATIAIAAKYTATHPQGNVEVRLGLGTYYKLRETVVLPERTQLIGAGADGQTIIEFDLAPPSPPGPPPTCSKPVAEDFYTNDCRARGCHMHECPGCFLELKAIHSAHSSDACCAACGIHPRCNAWTFNGAANNYCSLNYCPDEPKDGRPASCAATPNAKRISGWVINRTKVPLAKPAAIVVTGHGNRLSEFSLRIASAWPLMPAIWIQANATGFVASGLNVSLLQQNVSNAFKIEGVGWEIVNSIMNQVGNCNWPNHGAGADHTPFQPSTTIYAHDSRAGLLANNTIYWRCSAFDLDVSDRVIFEDNRIVDVNPWVVPHGNSISGYKWRDHPSSRWWSVARNLFSRPAYEAGTEQNWNHRETITTDGSGSWGTGRILAISGTVVQLRWLTFANPPKAGATLIVLHGPGVGQSRLITSVTEIPPRNNRSQTRLTNLSLSEPLDGWVRPCNLSVHGSCGGAYDPTARVSLVAVVSSFGSKIFVGNTFNWTEVVQWYGNTIRGVVADSTLINSNMQANVHANGSIARGSLGVVGECYHGSDPVWYSEFRQNTMLNSDGIFIRDGWANKTAEGGACAAYGGAWVRWCVVRGNAMTGLSLVSLNESAQTKSAPLCPAVAISTVGDKGLFDSTSDIVAEQNIFGCPGEGKPNSGGYHLGNCTACVERSL